MTDRELQIKCAEIVGYRNLRVSITPELYFGELNGECKRVPDYPTSRDACQELLEWAFKQPRMKMRAFIDGLWGILPKVDRSESYYREAQVWLLATPRQICKAFIQTFGGEK